MSSELPLKAGTLLNTVGMSQRCHVWTFAYHAYHSIIASARSRNVSGTVNSSSLAVLRLTVVRSPRRRVPALSLSASKKLLMSGCAGGADS